MMLAVLMMLCCGAAHAVVVTTSRDTHVNLVLVNNNYGSSDTIQVNAQSVALIWMNVDAVLPPGTPPEQVVKATLQLWPNKRSPNASGTLRVSQIESDWKGADVTAARKPQFPLTTGPIAGVTGANYYVLVDVTEIARNWVRLRNNFGFAVMAADNSINVWFDSKENAETGHPPLLDITLLNPQSTVAGKTFAVCTRSTRPNVFAPIETCQCSKTQLYKWWSMKPTAQCNAPAELNSCSQYLPKEALEDYDVISCCVCAP
jgi:hypothetical protein